MWGARISVEPAATKPAIVGPVPPTISPHAKCAATREDEQAVSIAMQGPRKPKIYDIQPHATETATPAPT